GDTHRLRTLTVVTGHRTRRRPPLTVKAGEHRPVRHLLPHHRTRRVAHQARTVLERPRTPAAALIRDTHRLRRLTVLARDRTRGRPALAVERREHRAVRQLLPHHRARGVAHQARTVSEGPRARAVALIADPNQGGRLAGVGRHAARGWPAVVVEGG